MALRGPGPAPASDSPATLRVAWIADPKKFGSKPGYPKPSLRDRLQKEAGWSFVRLTPEEVRKGALLTSSYDVFIVPGGYAPNFAAALGDLGGERIRDFVKAGGGYVGICAGAYLGTSWGYDLLPVNVLDIDHWDRGKTDACELSATDAGRRIAGKTLPATFAVRYANGPLLEILDSCVESFVDFQSQLRGKRGTYPPLMKGSPALLGGPLGKGRVLLVSPHIEGTKELGDCFRSFVRWTAEAGQPDITAATKPAAAPAVSDASATQPSSVPLAAPEVPKEAPKATEAEIVEIFRKFDLNGDSLLDASELEALLSSLDEEAELGRGLVELIAKMRLQESKGIPYEELVAWVFGAPCSFDRPDVETDGEEDAIMDKMSMVRMQCLAQFHSAEETGAEPGPPQLTRTCSDCCGGKQQVVSNERLEASVVAIQRAARARTMSKGAEDIGQTMSQAEKRETPEATAKPKAVPKATPKAPAPKAPPSGPILKKGLDYIYCLGGPVLITAPHSIKILRGGGDTQERTRNHKRERWTAEISMIVARELCRAGLPASVMVWNRAAGPGHGRLDPNYLLASQFRLSPWHRALHRWATTVGGGGPGSGAGIPLLHVDLHGKVSEKLHLDLGAAPLEEVWPASDQSFVRALKYNFCAKLDKVLADCRVLSLKGKQIKVDADPCLHGFWGEDTVTTISHQSVLLGIPAVQFEMPPRLREQLVRDPELGRRFADAIAEIYRDVAESPERLEAMWGALHNGSWIPRLAYPNESNAHEVVFLGALPRPLGLWLEALGRASRPPSKNLTASRGFQVFLVLLVVSVEETPPPGGMEQFEPWANQMVDEFLQVLRDSQLAVHRLRSGCCTGGARPAGQRRGG
ncbi:unnamed protein product, partial [Symbiodinium necroappetens]